MPFEFIDRDGFGDALCQIIQFTFRESGDNYEPHIGVGDERCRQVGQTVGGAKPERFIGYPIAIKEL